MSFFKTLGTIAVLGVFVSADYASATDYKHVVMADNPAVYYEFNETVGATQVLDTTTNTNFIDTDGDGIKDTTVRRHSQFAGTRTRARSSFDGFELQPGKNLVFGGLGPLGTMVEFNDPTPGGGNDDPSSPNFTEEAHGGYIETGLLKKFGPTSGDYTIEFLYRDNEIISTSSAQEQLISQVRASHPDSRVIDPETGLEIHEYIVGAGPVDYDPYDCDISPDFCANEGGADITLGQNNPGRPHAPGEITSYYGEGGYNPQNKAGQGDRNNSGVVPTQGKWMHIVQTFEQGGGPNGRGVIRWYFDGVLQGGENEILGSTALVSETLDFGDKGFNDSDTPLVLGAAGTFFFTGFYFDGFMDEFAVYDNRLDDPDGDGDMSDSRIAAHADAFAAAKASFSSADFDYDSDVDGTDFLTWQRSVGPDKINSGGVDFGPSAAGDTNADNVSDGVDLGIWENQFGTTTALAASTNVPEPSTGLLLGGLPALAAMGRRRVGASS